jgi:hypothetical protein
MQAIEISFFIRVVAGCRLLDHKRNENIAEELGISGKGHYKELPKYIVMSLFYISESYCIESLLFVVPTSVYNATIFNAIHTLFTKMLVKIHMSLKY